jgi:hypothetical protein
VARVERCETATIRLAVLLRRIRRGPKESATTNTNLAAPFLVTDDHTIEHSHMLNTDDRSHA